MRFYPVRLLDATWKVETGTNGYSQHFRRGHIPGATYMDLKAMNGTQQAGTFEACPLPEPDHFERYMSSLGVCSDCHVVIYDSLDNRSAARAWFLLRAYGHPCVSVLDGGLTAWQQHGYEICTGDQEGSFRPENLPMDIDTVPSPSKLSRVIFRKELFRDFVEMKEDVEQRMSQVVDCRPDIGGFYLNDEDNTPNALSIGSESHLGQSSSTLVAPSVSNQSSSTSSHLLTPIGCPSTSGSGNNLGLAPSGCQLPGGASFPGHMPGALNIPFRSLFTTTGTFKSLSELSRLFKAAGVDLSSPVVATCQYGLASCSLALAAFLLGSRDVSVYNGSWYEWERLAPPTLIVRARKRRKT